MILSANEIKQRISTGEIKIQDFDEARLGPNSYNLRLAEDLMVYREAVLDPKQDNRTNLIHIPPEGLVLKPGQLYLANTMEYTETHGLVPMLIGRSSIGRLGLAVHVLDAGAAGRAPHQGLSWHGNLSGVFPNGLRRNFAGIRREIPEIHGRCGKPPVPGGGPVGEARKNPRRRPA